MSCPQQEGMRRDQWLFRVTEMQRYSDWLTRAHAIRNATDIIVMIIN